MVSLPSCKHQKGITLVEVLVALVIFSVAISVGVTTLGDSVRNTRHMDNQTYAHWVAQNKMTELLLQPEWPPLGRTNGEIELEMGRHWYWQTEVKPTTAKNLRRIEVRVSLNRDTDNSLGYLVGFVGKKS